MNKRINRKNLLAFLVEKTGLEFSSDNFASKNIFFLCDKDSRGFTVEHYQVEFIAESVSCFYTIYFTSLNDCIGEGLHNQLVEYVTKLKLGRMVNVETCTRSNFVVG